MTGELVETVCPACSGTGVDEYVTVGGEDRVEGCVLCDARGVVEVCPTCGQESDAFSDKGGCNQVSPEVLYGISVGWLKAA